MTDAFPTPMIARAMTVTDLAHWGVPHIAYVKQVMVNNDVGWAIHTADGMQIGLAPDRDIAFASVRQHDLEPCSTH